MKTTETVYEENGYADRDDYLTSLSEEYNVDLETVLALADLLGPSEDFDGLVTELNSLTTNEIIRDAQEKHGIIINPNDENIHALIRYARLIGYNEGHQDAKRDKKIHNELKSLLKI